MNQNVPIVVLLLMVGAYCVQLRRRRLQAGQPITPRDIVLAMAVSWALGWCCLGLPPLFEWGQHVPWSQIVRASLLLMGLAIGPLVFVLAATR